MSDVHAFGISYFIFKVEEERTQEDSETREVKASQIQLIPEQSEQDRGIITERAQGIRSNGHRSRGLRSDRDK